MKVFALFYGGSGYGLPDITSRDDVEEFQSIQEAEDSLISRKHDPYYPCVTCDPPEDGGMWMEIYRDDPYNSSDPIPDYRLQFNQWGKAQRIRV